MASPKDRLTKAFNDHAAKLSDAREIGKLIQQYLSKNLSSNEFQDLGRKGSHSGAAGLPNTKGLYLSDSALYINIGEYKAALEKMTTVDGIPASVAEKVTEALANAIETSHDYSADVQSGRLKIVPMPSRFK